MSIRFGRSRGFWAWLGILVLQAVAVVLVSPMPASAAAGDLECVINFQFTFDPPLTATHTTGQTTATAGFVDCDSPNGRFSDLRSGNAVTTGASVTSSSGPCDLIITIVGDGRVDWNTGDTSKFSFTVNTNPANGAITLSATIRSGPLKNDTITAVPVIAHPNLDCALNGLSTLVADLGLILIG